MKRENLLAALQDECLVDRTKIEDFLKALADLCVETLSRGEAFTIPEIGTIRPTGSTGRRIVNFASSERIRNQVGTPAPLCIACKKNEREPRRKKCAECRRARLENRTRSIDGDRFSLLSVRSGT